MFEKLLSLLPYNPNLAHQMSFYSQRMREEASIRRIGVIFLVLTFFVQFFAVLSPPKPTSAAPSSNNMVRHRINSADPATDAADTCSKSDDQDAPHYKEIMAYFGITCDDISHGDHVTIHPANQDFFSMGHMPYKFNREQQVVIPNVDTQLFVRPLASFGSKPYDALHITSSATGQTFWIIYDCGNLASIGPPAPHPLTPIVIPKPPILIPKPPIIIPKTTAPVVPAPAPAPVPAPAPPPTPCPSNSSISINDSRCQPCKYNPAIDTNSTECKPCDKSSGGQDSLSCVTLSKTAANVTGSISDANNTTANPGDTITYTLSAKNNAVVTIKDFTFQENISDVLNYADITDLHGGTFDQATGLITWPGLDIASGGTAAKQITIKVKAAIPQTAPSAANPNDFNLIMTNVYGNAINIRVPGSPAKAVETAAATLPNTGPGTSLFIGGIIVMAAGYFYGRSRLLAKESMLAIKETAVA